MAEIIFLDKEHKYGILKDSKEYCYSGFLQNITGKTQYELVLNLIKKIEELNIKLHEALHEGKKQ